MSARKKRVSKYLRRVEAKSRLRDDALNALLFVEQSPGKTTREMWPFIKNFLCHPSYDDRVNYRRFRMRMNSLQSKELIKSVGEKWFPVDFSA
jgi:hypothetical protein